MQPLVHIIILNYNGRKWLEACFKSLLQTAYENYKVMLADNGSNDGSIELVRRKFPQVEIIENKANLGFSEGNNVGIRRAMSLGAEYVVLLNNDVKVDPRWLSEMVNVGESDEDIGILGAVQLNYEDDEFNNWTTAALNDHLEELAAPEKARQWIPVAWVEGSCFAVKRRVFDEIGLLDAIYFSFYEEIDFCRRARYHCYKIGLVPRSRIHHHRGGSWESDPGKKRERDYHCDLGQFIYTLTDPGRSLIGNVGAHFVAFGIKIKDLFRSFSLDRAWDLLRMQRTLMRNCGSLLDKWKHDRNRLREA